MFYNILNVHIFAEDTWKSMETTRDMNHEYFVGNILK